MILKLPKPISKPNGKGSVSASGSHGQKSVSCNTDEFNMKNAII
jgi:hypothetical protein